MGWLSLAFTAAAGCLLVYRFSPIEKFHPQWVWLLTTTALGCAAGLGCGSCLFFLLLWAGQASAASVLAADAGLLMVAALIWRRRSPEPRQKPPAAPEGRGEIWLFRGAAALVVAALLSGWWMSTRASPHGDWDAFSIWNLRAKFLAGGSDVWRHAVARSLFGGHLGAAHPDYPLLLSGLVGQAWMLSGGVDVAFPAVIGLVFDVLLLALLAGALTWLRDERAGWLGLLLLGGGELFASQIAAQYADIPLACYALGTVALLAGAQGRPSTRSLPFWAGLLAALAAWTKNEGLVFFLLALGWCGWRWGRRSVLAFLAGAAPSLAVVLCFKLLLAPATAGLFPATVAQAASKLADPQRWWLIVQSYARTFWDLGFWWAHPVALAVIWIWAAGPAGPAHRRQMAVGLIPAAMLAADFLVYLLTVADLRWHLSTSVNRLWLEMWPSLLMSLLLAAGGERPQDGAAVARRRAQRGSSSPRRCPS